MNATSPMKPTPFSPTSFTSPLAIQARELAPHLPLLPVVHVPSTKTNSLRAQPVNVSSKLRKAFTKFLEQVSLDPSMFYRLSKFINLFGSSMAIAWKEINGQTKRKMSSSDSWPKLTGRLRRSIWIWFLTFYRSCLSLNAKALRKFNIRPLQILCWSRTLGSCEFMTHESGRCIMPCLQNNPEAEQFHCRE